MDKQPASPMITRITWGRMLVEGVGEGKDFKLWPGGGREWDWRETGTRHVPGIQPTDVDELIENGSTTVVLSKGMWRMLRVQDRTVDYLETRGVAVRVAETNQAVEIYNELAEQRAPIGGLFHSTC